MNTPLGKDETIIKEATFSPNLLLFWLKSHFVLTNKRLTGHAPNTLAGIIPLGKRNISQPLKTIASVSCVSKFWFGRLVTGLIFLTIGMVMVAEISGFLGMIIALIGVGFVLTCYTAYFNVFNNGGLNMGTEVIITGQAQVESFANEINQVISDL